MRYRLERRMIVPAPLPEVFAFFEDPRNLEAITPPWLRFRVVGSSDARMRLGTRIRYALRLAGIPLRWESRISEYAPLSHFADEQLRGPYRHWYHRHEFIAVPSGVEMRDTVEYELPFGPLGRLVHRLVVRHQLRAIFDHRTAAITRRFGASRADRGEAAHPLLEPTT